MEELITSQGSGGQILENASVIWQPITPGKYDIYARAWDKAGNPGGKASIEIEIIEEDAENQEIIPTESLTDNLCSGDQLSAPVLLSPNDGSEFEGKPQLQWSYPDNTCHPQSFKVDISLDSSFSDISLGFGTLDFNETSRIWELPLGNCYYWRVIASIPGANGPASPIWRFCITKPTEATDIPPSIMMNQNSNCRQGPAVGYLSENYAAKGISLLIEGRNLENTWYLVRPTESANSCWVYGFLGVVSGDPMKAPVVEVAPIPTVQVTATTEPFTFTTITPDTIPPVISDIQFIPPVIAASGPIVCPGYIDVDIIVIATDNNGYLDVYAEVMDTALYTKLLPMGSNTYQQAVTPGSVPGTKRVIIHAFDKAGNETIADWASFQVVPCLQ
jgi:hypothetical protein